MRPIKLLPTILVALLFITSNLSAQVTCNGQRYKTEGLFTVDVTDDVQYGQGDPFGFNPSGELRMDIYEPAGDTDTERPVIIMEFGGSFVAGIRQSPDVVEFCNRFTSMGYVCISIDYRVGFFFPINQETTTLAVVRAMHDMKAAIRYLRKDVAENGNTYGIDTNNIIVGGVSAGAIGAIHTAYLDKDSEIPTYFDAQTVADFGGIEGNSGTPGYSSEVAGVINLCGTIGDSLWLDDASNPPMVSLHGTDDGTVPIGSGPIDVQGTPTGLDVDGTASIKVRSDNLGHTHAMYIWEGAGHVPFVSQGGGSLGQIIEPYMDTTVWFTRDFLYDEVVCKADPVGIVSAPIQQGLLEVYPNPSNGLFNLDLKDLPVSIYSLRVYDVLGRSIQIRENLVDRKIQVDLSDALKGNYYIELIDEASGAVKATETISLQ